MGKGSFKSPVFLKKQPGSKDKSAHFAIAHYAGELTVDNGAS